MPTMKPTIGRRIWFWPNGVTSVDQGGPLALISTEQPMDAGIVYVWGDNMVNLDVTDHYGNHHRATSVRLLAEGEAKPAVGAYATWMPYQQAQAAKESQHPAVAAASPVGGVVQNF